MISGPRCGLPWRMFYVYLKRKCIILHLDRKSWRYQLGPFGIMFNLRFVLPYWFSVLLICPLMQVGCWSPLLLLCYCQFPLLCLLGFVFVLRCSYVGSINYADYYVVSFLVSYNILYFKIYFVWNKNCHSVFLLVSIHMEYLFASFYFQPICVSKSEVGLL